MKRILLLGLIGVACNLKEGENTALPSTPAAIAPTPGPQPTFLEPRTLQAAPPPISGGTLSVAPDGHTVFAADPDRDQVYVVDIPSRTVKHTVKLAPNSEPGRIAIDSKGRGHVALRSSGAIATIDPVSGVVTESRACVAPRGIAYDETADSLRVACAEGFLVTVPLAAGGAIARLGLDKDIRDVVVLRDSLLVSHFRDADVVEVLRDGNVKGRSSTKGGNLGWRIAAASPNGPPAMVSQDPINPGGSIPQGYYGSGPPSGGDACLAPTITSTRLDIPGEQPIRIPAAVLPVDLATNGREYAIVAAGNGHTKDLPQIFIHAASAKAPSSTPFGPDPRCTALVKGYVPGQAIAAVFDGDDQLIVQSREPAALYIMTPDRKGVYKEISLSADSREDTGHAIFHSNSGGFLACASCHAEGGEDGRTWSFVEGDRRTPSMRGTVAHTAPFHWDGQMKDLRHIVDHVFTTRMSGPHIGDREVGTLQEWLFRLPAPPKIAQDAIAVERGQNVFRQRGCEGCHSGAALTNNETRDVGTGGSFQVPSLIGVGWRGPFLHNGCAKTLTDRFDPACGGDKHGDLAGLADSELKDLSVFLESL